MIKTKKELDFYIKADRIMNGLPLVPSFKEKILSTIMGGGGLLSFRN